MIKSRFKILMSHKRPGFTLMEVVIVLLIFTLASLLIAEIFVNIQRAGQRTRDLQSAYTDARYVLEVMAREIRSGTIDYSAYGGVIDPITDKEILYLTTSEGASLIFEKQDDCSGTTTNCIMISRNGGVDNPITSPKLEVNVLNFYVTPSVTPFPDVVDSSTPDIQPQVTIVLKTTSTNIKPEQQTSTYLQTTVTSRAYYR